MQNIPVRNINAAQKEPGFLGSFCIRDIRGMLAEKDMVHQLHRHDFFFILALEKGKGHHEIDFVSYEVSDCSVFFIRPGQVHQLMLKAGGTGHLVQFTPGFYDQHDKVLKQQFRKASQWNLYQFDSNGFNRLLVLLTHILYEYTNKHEGYQEAIKANLTLFFIELVRWQGKGHLNHANLYMQERLEEFLELLEENTASVKQVSQYADMLNLSPYQLNAITKGTLGKTCSELINEHILLQAKRYLLASSNQVNQIAYHLGYEDVSYFIRFFKKHTGYSPEAFRHNSR
ncbi:MAG: helix-turn-helix transcriptional regulator [Cytophagales bacterium]|nr:helix-turn-helix transcriptional regulator [Cytophagales bacterium]